MCRASINVSARFCSGAQPYCPGLHIYWTRVSTFSDTMKRVLISSTYKIYLDLSRNVDFLLIHMYKLIMQVSRIRNRLFRVQGFYDI